jgi:CRISPR/Cas system endoribonuclease Cas6 (RAMP superfamily)
MLLVEIEKPENEPLSVWFSTLRAWLDENRCNPTLFARSGRRIDRLIYRISFDDAVLAHQFCQAFKEYEPAVRRATAFERDQLRSMGTGSSLAAS